MILAALLKTVNGLWGLDSSSPCPCFFASNALYPIEIMPSWLKVLAKVNPLSYIVDLMRSLLISGDLSNCVTDLTVLVADHAGLVGDRDPGLSASRVLIVNTPCPLVVRGYFFIAQQEKSLADTGRI